MEPAGAGHREAPAELLCHRQSRNRPRALEQFQQSTNADEIIVAAAIYDHEARLRSYESLADVVGIK